MKLTCTVCGTRFERQSNRGRISEFCGPQCKAFSNFFDAAMRALNGADGSGFTAPIEFASAEAARSVGGEMFRQFNRLHNVARAYERLEPSETEVVELFGEPVEIDRARVLLQRAERRLANVANRDHRQLAKRIRQDWRAVANDQAAAEAVLTAAKIK